MKKQTKPDSLLQSSSQILHDKLLVYISMRNIKVPVLITSVKNLYMEFRFTNMTVEFTASNKKTIYEDAIAYIEEMNTEYTTKPVKHFTLIEDR